MMTKNTHRWLIVTDLDGTLLDHDNYSFTEAKPSLEALKEQHIPVVINSSKTQAEIDSLREELNNEHPFIIENGSAIVIPQNYFDKEKSSSSKPLYSTPLFDKITLGLERKKLLDIIPLLNKEFDHHFVNYSQMTESEIADITGLSLDNAKKSATRFYTEPIQWLGDKEKKQEFLRAITNQGLHTLEGGRFIHLMGHTDKGKALEHIKDKYMTHYQQAVKTIALGDSQNDVAMLQAADIAVVIRSPHYPPPEFQHPNKIISQSFGPKGWHECIQQLIFTQPY